MSLSCSNGLMGFKMAHSCRYLQAAEKLWPEIFNAPEAKAREGELVEKMRIVRPVVETG